MSVGVRYTYSSILKDALLVKSNYLEILMLMQTQVSMKTVA